MHQVFQIFILVFVVDLPWRVLPQYRTPCTSLADCSKTRFLECDERSWMCSCPKALVWDPVVKECRIGEGGSCNSQHQHGKFYNSNEKCVSNTTCSSGFCECDEGLLKNGFGTCSLSFGLGCSPNKDNEPCAWRYQLQCSPELMTCQCRGEPNDQKWDEMRQKCVSLVGSGCDMDSLGKDDSLECADNSHCVNGHCECNFGYSPAPDGHCYLEYGQHCNNDEGRRCNRHKLYNCGPDGKCGCMFYAQMKYLDDQCRMLVGEVCDLLVLDVNNFTGSMDFQLPYECVKDAECKRQDHHGPHAKGICACSEGRFQTEDGTCSNIRGYGKPCSFAGDCNTTQFLTCVIAEDVEGVCGCTPQEMFWDTKKSSCVVYPGRSCVQNNQCANNSHCDEDGKYCNCNEGLLLDSDNLSCTPLAHVDPQVLAGYSCDSFPETSMDFAKCNCRKKPEVNYWSDIKRLCVGLVGSICNDDSDCPDLGYCDPEVGTCQCDETIARTTINRTCILRKSFTRNPSSSTTLSGINESDRNDEKTAELAGNSDNDPGENVEARTIKVLKESKATTIFTNTLVVFLFSQIPLFLFSICIDLW